MTRPEPQRLDAEELLRTLSTRQYLHPHRPLADALADLAGTCGLCSAAAATVMARLGLHGERAIGRLTRSELAHLARIVARLCRHSLSGAPDRQAAN